MSTARRIKNAAGELRSQDEISKDVENLVRQDLFISNREISRRLGVHYNRIGTIRRGLEQEDKLPTVRCEVERLWKLYENSRMVSKVLGGKLSPAEVRKIVGISKEDERDKQIDKQIKAREHKRDVELYDRRELKKSRLLTSKERAMHWGKSRYGQVAVIPENKLERTIASHKRRLLRGDKKRLANGRKDLWAPDPLDQKERQRLEIEIQTLEARADENPLDPELHAQLHQLEQWWNLLLRAEVSYRLAANFKRLSDGEEPSEWEKQIQAKKEANQDLLNILEASLPGFEITRVNAGLADDERLVSILGEKFVDGNDLAKVVAARNIVADLMYKIRLNYPEIDLRVEYYLK